MPDDRVLIVDDWAETGQQLLAAVQALERCGARLVGVSVMVDQLDAESRTRLPAVASLVSYAELATLPTCPPT